MTSAAVAEELPTMWSGGRKDWWRWFDPCREKIGGRRFCCYGAVAREGLRAARVGSEAVSHRGS